MNKWKEINILFAVGLPDVTANNISNENGGLVHN